ncbi:MAG TPA: ABC transporter permease [Flavisolibacter sp.]
MGNLLKTEWLKIKNYRIFWWMAVISALTYPGINYIFYQIYKEFLRETNKQAKGMLDFMIGNPFTFPEVWHTVAFASSIFVYIPAIVVIMFITNEYTYKTHRQNIIDGWSRNRFISAKMVDVLIISLVMTIIYLLVAFGIGYTNMEDSTGDMWSKSQYILFFFLQTFSQLSIAFLIAFLTRKAFIALGIFIFYKLILEKLLVGLAEWKLGDIGRFLPFEISNRIIPYPAFIGRFSPDKYQVKLDQVNEHVIYTILLIALTWFLCYKINQKRDL